VKERFVIEVPRGDEPQDIQLHSTCMENNVGYSDDEDMEGIIV